MTPILAASIGSDLFRATLQGLPAAAVYALVALGFVLTYKTSGVFNLAFGAQAYVSAAMYFKARVVWNWGILPSVVLAVFVLAPLVGLILERLIFRHLRAASAIPKLVVAIGLSVALPYLFDLLANFHALAGQTPVGVIHDGASVFYDPFGSYAFSRDELVAMVVAVVAMLGLGALFRFSALGLRMRAVVESSRMTELNGVNADRVSAFSWALSSFFAGLAGVLIAPRFNTLDAGDFFQLMVVAIAAAAFGRLLSLPRALFGGLALGVLIAQMNTFVPRWSASAHWLQPIQDNITPAIPFIVLFIVLVGVPSIRRARESGDPLSGVDPPPLSLGSGAVGGRRITPGRLVLAAFVVIAFTVVFTRGDSVWLFLVTQAVVYGTIFLSITVITGMAGQISLCQGAFGAIGAYTVFQMVTRYGMSVLLAGLLGAVIAAVVGALLAIPIRKLGAVWTAIATLAFAYFFDAVIVNLSFVGGGNTALSVGTTVPRPIIGPWNFGSDKLFLALAIAVFVVVAVAVTQVRVGTLGRTLRALRGSEVGASSIGISPGRARVLAFAISAFIAGIGGALLAIQQQNVNYSTNFAPFAALFWLVLVVTFGERTVEGAAVSAATFSLFDAVILNGALLGWILRNPDRIPHFFPLSQSWEFVLFGVGAVQFARHPEGVIEYNRRRKAARVGGPASSAPPTPAAGAGGVGTATLARPAIDAKDALA